MKRVVLYMLLACLLPACQKEDGITPGTGFENLYIISDNPEDSIQHKRYELYVTYGVPVFFNDTIGKVFVKMDVDGDSVFHYETLDLNWTFSGTNSGSVSYRVTRMTDPGLMMKSLRFAEIFLKNSQPALYPYAMWLTEKCWQLSSAGVEEMEMISRYRNLMFSWIDGMKEEEMPEKAASYRNEVVKLKVQNYADELKAFNSMTDESQYEKNWADVYPDEILPYWSASVNYWYPRPLEEEWEQKSSYREDMKGYGNSNNPDWPQGVWTDETVDSYILYCRGLVGALGFVCYDTGKQYGARWTPHNVDIDLDLYLIEMMKYPRKQFLERWEGSPLVIKKYEILYAIIRDKLGVEL